MTVNEELLAFAADLANELEHHEGRERARSADQKIAFANTVHALLLRVLHSSRNPHKHPILLRLHQPDYLSSNRYRPMPVSYRQHPPHAWAMGGVWVLCCRVLRG